MALVALRTDGRTYLGEAPPDGPPQERAVLVAAPEPLSAESLLPAALPGAWGSDGVTDLATLARSVETAQKRAVPWSLVSQFPGHSRSLPATGGSIP